MRNPNGFLLMRELLNHSLGLLWRGPFFAFVKLIKKIPKAEPRTTTSEVIEIIEECTRVLTCTLAAEGWQHHCSAADVNGRTAGY